MRLKNKIIYVMLLWLAIQTTLVSAQTKISLVRYNDDFLTQKNDSNKRGFNKLKYISLGDKKYISFGGELREQLQFYKNINFGDIPATFKKTTVEQLNHRLMLHSNIELNDRVRFFMQINNTLRFLNENPPVPEIDENQLSVHQAFIEIKTVNKWQLRSGRQELLYGNHRLITVREGPNTRKAFDGFVARGVLNSATFDLIIASPVISNKFVFDDVSLKESLIGVYATKYFKNRTLGLDIIALNFQSRLRKYNYQSGFENRQTYGFRFFSDLKTINFEIEGEYQSGTFNKLTISAYNAFADLNATVIGEKKGITGITFNISSGDKSNTDTKLNTYNLLFAKPAYGLAVPIGATNIISISPYIKINPTQKLNVLAQVFLLSRNSSCDGTYSPAMLQNRPKPSMIFNSDKKALGELYVLELNYQQSKNISFALDGSYFNAGSYPISTGMGNNVTYLSAKSVLRF